MEPLQQTQHRQHLEPRPSRRTRAVAVSVLALGAVLAGCGTGEPDDSISPSASSGPLSSTVSPSAGADDRAPRGGTTGSVTVTATSVVLGDVEAPRRVLVYSDLACPHCQVLHTIMASDVERWSAGSDVAVELVTVDYLSPRTTHQFSTRGANLLALVADESPAAWPAVLSALFEAQPTSTTDDALSTDDLLTLADGAGATLGAGAADAVEQLAFSGWVDGVTAEAATAGVRSIPRVLVDGTEVAGSTHEETARMVREALGE